MALTQTRDLQLERRRFLSADAELASVLDNEVRDVAIRALSAPVAKLPSGLLDPADAQALLRLVAHGPGLLILSGVALERTQCWNRPTAEVVGAGDLVSADAEADAAGGCTSAASRSFEILEPVEVALLDGWFSDRAQRVPALYAELLRRACRRQRHLARQLAILHHPTIERRIELLFCDLADRWGRVTADGIRIPFGLTHRQIGELVGAQRPSVTVALKRLAEQERLQRTSGYWVVAAAYLEGQDR